MGQGSRMFGLLFQFELSLKSLAVQKVWAWVAPVRGEDTGNKKKKIHFEGRGHAASGAQSWNSGLCLI